MLIDLLRGICIAILSAIIISFVILFFTPLLPFNLFEGYLGILFFLAVTGLSYLVYIVLPTESLSIDLNTLKNEPNNSDHISRDMDSLNKYED
ncbi:MAG: hypothetical protein JSV04_02545 [Candidatus Heimdallarchaeota archaeon]|nr:MAG: hypothetical protein JSV04_02545 [Candidatus Heimdallarchaeota archaeon]